MSVQCKIEEAINLNEKRKLQKFLVEHQVYCTDIKTKCNYSLRFSREGGIGTSTEVVCSTCGKVHDITDYAEW